LRRKTKLPNENCPPIGAPLVVWSDGR
jgi:hypothetical protein